MDVVEYRGVVAANVTAGRHAGKDFLAGLRNFFGGRSQSWENTLQEAQQQALRELCSLAEERGANGIVAIDLEDEVVGAGGGMINVKVVGTAVVVEESRR